MSAIDHKAEAEALIALSEKSTGDPTVWLLAAQGHATLALVEEQRTANLIANMNADQSAGYRVSDERLLEIQGRLA